MALHNRNKTTRAKITSFGKELANDVSHIASHLLSQWANVKSMLHRLHKLRATMKATLINLCRDSSMPFIATALRITNQRKNASFCALCLCQLINEHNWEDLCIQLRNHQTCTFNTSDFQSKLSRCFIVDLLMQHKFLICVNLIGGSWRT